MADLAREGLDEDDARRAVPGERRVPSNVMPSTCSCGGGRLLGRVRGEHDGRLPAELRRQITVGRELVAHGQPARPRRRVEAQDEVVVVLDLAHLAGGRRRELVLRRARAAMGMPSSRIMYWKAACREPLAAEHHAAAVRSRGRPRREARCPCRRAARARRAFAAGDARRRSRAPSCGDAGRAASLRTRRRRGGDGVVERDSPADADARQKLGDGRAVGLLERGRAQVDAPAPLDERRRTSASSAAAPRRASRSRAPCRPA